MFVLMLTTFIFLSCAEPDADDDTGTAGPADGGAAPTAELCREVLSDYDIETTPREVWELNEYAQYLAAWGNGEVQWTDALDGAEATAITGSSSNSTSYLAIVEWVADGGAEAIHPCQAGPALRLGVRAHVALGDGSATGEMEGFIDGSSDVIWLTRLRTTEVDLGADWRSLVDDALSEAGRSGADSFMALSTEAEDGVMLSIGSEDADWSERWWYGEPVEGQKVPTSLGSL